MLNVKSNGTAKEMLKYQDLQNYTVKLVESYGFTVYGCRSGHMGFLYIVGDSQGSIGSHEITIPEEWSTDSFYCIYTFPSDNTNSPAKITFTQNKINIYSILNNWSDSRYLCVTIACAFRLDQFNRP